jgi:hypothetical protein
MGSAGTEAVYTVNSLIHVCHLYMQVFTGLHNKGCTLYFTNMHCLYKGIAAPLFVRGYWACFNGWLDKLSVRGYLSVIYLTLLTRKCKNGNILLYFVLIFWKIELMYDK